MSEHLKKQEHLSEPETTSAEKPTEQSERPAKTETAELNVEEMRQEVERLEDGARLDLNKKLNVTSKADEPLPPSKAVKSAALNNALSSIRSNLSAPSKSFSKIIHNQTVEKLSDVAAKTIVRPYAVLLGGIFTLIGSALYLFYLRHTGYKYNFFVPILLFAGGFVVDIVVELLLKTTTRKKRS